MRRLWNRVRSSRAAELVPRFKSRGEAAMRLRTGRMGMCDFELKCLHLAFVSHPAGRFRRAVNAEGYASGIQRASYLTRHPVLTFGKSVRSPWIGLKIGFVVKWTSIWEKNWFALRKTMHTEMTLHCHGDLFVSLSWLTEFSEWHSDSEHWSSVTTEGFTYLDLTWQDVGSWGLHMTDRSTC